MPVSSFDEMSESLIHSETHGRWLAGRRGALAPISSEFENTDAKIMLLPSEVPQKMLAPPALV